MAPPLAGRHHRRLRLFLNREGIITNLELKLATLVLHKASVLAEVPEAKLAAPRSGLDKNPTVSWSTKEASIINPVVADLLRLHALC